MRWSSLPALFLLVVFVGLAAGCKVEEDLFLEADGSGEYRIEVSVQKALGALPQLRQALVANGFEIVAERETGDSNVVVARRTFETVGEIGDLDASFEVAERGWLRRSYRLGLRVDDMEGATERILRVHLPARVDESSGGRIEGSTVIWEGIGGGRLEIAASGPAVPGGETALYAAAAGLLVVLLALVAIRRRAVHGGRDAAAASRRCGSCGAAHGATAFCTRCGAALATGAASGSALP